MQDTDPQARWKRPEARNQPVAQTVQKTPYTAFIEDKNFSPRMLQVRRGATESDRGFQYAYFEEASTDNWSVLSSMYCPPNTLALVLTIYGENLEPLVSAFMRGTLQTVQVFNPEKHLEPEAGQLIVREIELSDKPLQSTATH